MGVVTPEHPDGPDRRVRTARGTLVNTGYLVWLHGLSLLKTFLVAAFLTRSEYGVWGILVVAIGTLVWLKDVGVGDKYVQQDEDDQETAFQKAFTLEAILTGGFLVLVLATLPLFALAYGQSELIPTGLVIAAAIPALALRAPTWVFYRDMRFLKQRVLEAVDPLISFVVTVALAAAGMGYWSLVIGYFAGAWSAAAAALIASPYPLRLRFERGTAREYLSFSWPLLVASGSAVLIPQVTMLVGEAELGLAGAGTIALAASVSVFAERIDQVVTWTIYPAVCRIKDRAELMFEAFVKSNRLVLLVGIPFGVGIALFAPDIVEYGIGDHWEPAVGLLQVFGLIAAADQVGFNWTAFFRARGDTRPIAIVVPLVVLAFLLAAVPGLILYGLDGFAVGMAVMTAVSLAGRTYFLTRLFPGFRMLRHFARAVAPTAPAVALTLAIRALDLERTAAIAAAELAVYLAVTAGATLLLERELLREVSGYLRGRRAPVPAGA
jgi:O-antigen/teichoic acid export membrane protein